MTTLNQSKDILIAARAKIETPETWTQHALARDIGDNDKPPNHLLAGQIFWEGLDGRDPAACKFCALGALQAVTLHHADFQVARDALNRAAYTLFNAHNIESVNDEHGHTAVLQCYDEAIEKA